MSRFDKALSSQQIRDRPQLPRDPGLHRRSHADAGVNPSESERRDVQRERRAQVSRGTG